LRTQDAEGAEIAALGTTARCDGRPAKRFVTFVVSFFVIRIHD
jgi:hypothetical protein